MYLYYIDGTLFKIVGRTDDTIYINDYNVNSDKITEGSTELTIGGESVEIPIRVYAYYNSSGSKSKLVISAVNYRKLWDITMIKTDSATGGILSGALFALYSPDPNDQIDEDVYALLKEQYGLEPPLTVEVKNTVQESTAEDSSEDTDSADNENIDGSSEADTQENTTTYYLMQTAVSGSNGQIQWTGLIYSEYCIVELKAPDGYNLNDTPLVVRSENYEDVMGIKVENVMGYVLPETGGIGTQLYTIGGALVITGSLLGYGINKRRRRKGESKA